ncbi:hypothetical protein INT45_002305 [Circinella minor]|uniref:Uncharacterized protein n=1 Tax=Circinella minor TaxID=1195481 RepID=A0A8H7SDL7_9FUNG|nr:hypothetical protein INT45_002305 [Circinella minor]
MFFYALVPLAILLFTNLLPSNACCSYHIYNKTEDGIQLFVEQIDDGQHDSSKRNIGAFQHSIVSSASAIQYRNGNRNGKDKKDAINSTFTIYYGGDRPYNPVNLRRVSCPADGYIVAKGKGDDIRYESYDADHKLVETVRTK